MRASQWPVLLYIVLGFPLGLSPLQVLSIDLGTELLPSMSLAYETAEDSVLSRPPRDLKKDRLVSFPLLSYSYLVVGMLEAAICTVAYLVSFLHNDVDLADLPFSAEDHWHKDADPLMSNGRVIGAAEQERIAGEARSAWYISLIICQFIHIWFVRSRFSSIIHRCGELNPMMVIGAVFELAVAMLVVYVPFLHPVFETSTAWGVLWLLPLGFALFLAPLAETCKARARHGRGMFGLRAFIF